MWFNIIMAAFFFGVWYMQTLQGAYSALIMLVLTTLWVGFTFDLFETAAAMLDFWPAYAPGIAFMAVFAVGLTALRFVYDRIAPANMYFHVLIDRPIAGVFGLFTALVVSGVAAIGMEMLPMGPALIDYDRVGLATEPKSSVTKSSIVGSRFEFTETTPMQFETETASEISRQLWFRQDEFAFGLYNQLLSAGFLSDSKKPPRAEYLEKNVDAAEFLARLWDWRMQCRFEVTPAGLRVPTATDTPLRAGRIYSWNPGVYDKLKLNYPLNMTHVYVVVEFPRRFGVSDWYLSQTRRGTFPQVLPATASDAFNPDEGTKVASFAYWQMKLIVHDRKTGKDSEYPLRAVWGLNFAKPKEKGKSGPQEIRQDIFQQLTGMQPLNAPAGNVALLVFPSEGSLFVRLVFFCPIDEVKNKPARIKFTRIPENTFDLADAEKRKQLEFLSPGGAAALPINEVADPLLVYPTPRSTFP